MNCEGFRELYWEAQDGDADSSFMSERAGHLSACPHCRAYGEKARRLDRLLESSFAAVSSPDLAARVLARTAPRPARTSPAKCAAALLIGALALNASLGWLGLDVWQILRGAFSPFEAFSFAGGLRVAWPSWLAPAAGCAALAGLAADLMLLNHPSQRRT